MRGSGVMGRGALGLEPSCPAPPGERRALSGPCGQAALETQPPESDTSAPTLIGFGGPYELVKGVHQAWASHAVCHGPFPPK